MSRPTRRATLRGAAALAAGGCAGDAAPGAARPPPHGKPHIIFLYPDQMRWDAPGFGGNPVAVTPHMDALALESVRFGACVTNGPSCRAARATMLTGLHVHEHGVWTNSVVPDPALPSHVRRIRDEADYFTMVVGKTHLHNGRDHMDDHKRLLREWGFVDSVELPDPQQFYWESAHSDYLTATTPDGEQDKFLRWQAYTQDYVWESPPPDTAPWNLATSDHLDTFCGATAADFVRQYADDRPLYLQVCYPGPHKPFDPTTEFLDAIDPDDPRMPLPVLTPPQPPIAPLVATYMGPKMEEWTEASARALRQHYYGKVGLVDAAIGPVIQALKDTGMYDDAWVVLSSDHGELAADHSLTGKVLSYEGAIRVPLLVKPPKWLAAAVGWDDLGQVDQRDLTATFLAMAGLDPDGMGDRDLVARILGGAAAHEDKPVMFENLGAVGIRTSRFTMTWDLELGHPVELYDRDADPQQVLNRVTDPALREDLDALVATLRELRPLDRDEWPS